MSTQEWGQGNDSESYSCVPIPLSKVQNSLFNRHHAHRRAANIDPLPSL